MPNFFEKLKKGMGNEVSLEEEVEEKAEIPQKKRVRKTVKEKPMAALKINKIELASEEPTEKEVEVEELSPAEPSAVKEKWANFNQASIGQLAIDIYQTANELVIQSAIAGVRPASLDVTIEKDIVTITGIREKPLEETGDYFTQECYWGPFAREVILPTEVDPNRVEAEMKDGILTIRIPKILRDKKRRIIVKG